jgi:hypothetical protein
MGLRDNFSFPSLIKSGRVKAEENQTKKSNKWHLLFRLSGNELECGHHEAVPKESEEIADMVAFQDWSE